MRLTRGQQPIETIELLSKLFRGFADQSRLSILDHLKKGELTVGDLVEKTGLSQPNVSNHLSCLKECGLVLSEQRARFVFYRLRGARVRKVLSFAMELLQEVLPELERCANYEAQARKEKRESVRKVMS